MEAGTRAGPSGEKRLPGPRHARSGPETSDLARFTQLVAQARSSRQDGDPASAVAHYTEGLGLWTGPALAGICGPYATTQRRRMSELRLVAEEERLACAIDLRPYNQAAAELSAFTADHPLRERLCELHMAVHQRILSTDPTLPIRLARCWSVICAPNSP
ncbi:MULTISPECIES: AfsR/SARP family transcriptional regulator [Streptomyces]|uniref:Transcriptional regulator n=1 Tax=Streptomyces sviceus (strain ATCC 29083 / DSM 924 / JCM 4929 / NBRC 13980 / NCIMB 11184 / NRRL 5439 / UC 5370) TaxID=463191 RepID=B5I2J1_STRX2|nr:MULTISPECIES: AfsR/SARP family transcriptional regulator [Streptomyces]EDY59296.1 transcriptional regulator [Streptomyces sviceus ATCC 29083]